MSATELDRPVGTPVRVRVAVVLGLVVLGILTSSIRADAFLELAAPVAPVAIPSVLGGAGAISGGAAVGTGTTGAVAATWPAATGVAATTAGVGLLPIVAGVAIGAVVAGGLYVGYRQLTGDPVEWFWQDGDPAAVEALPLQPAEVASSFTASNGVTFTSSDCGPYGPPIGTAYSLAWGFRADLTGASCNLHSNTIQSLTYCITAADEIVAHTSYFGNPSTAARRNWPIGAVEPCPSGSVPFAVAVMKSPTLGQIWFYSDVPAGSQAFADGAVATVRADLECTPEGGGAPFTVSASSAAYSDPNAPAAIPDATCPEGSRITDAQLFRELPGQTPLPLTQPLTAPVIAPAPSWVPQADEDLWDLCSTGACKVDLWEIDGPTGQRLRKLAPPGDLGWQTRPNREVLYDCTWTGPGGEVLTFPDLSFCSDLQWEGSSTGEITQPATAPGSPTTELDAPTSSTSGTRCDTGGTESGFLGSGIIKRGVLCALQAAFVPSESTMTQLQELGTETTTTVAPFAYLAPALDALEAFDQAQGECFDITAQLPVGWLGAEVPTAKTLTIIDTCGNDAIVQRMQQLRPLLLAMAYVSFFGPMLWWAWRTYAPASTSSA